MNSLSENVGCIVFRFYAQLGRMMAQLYSQEGVISKLKCGH